MNVEKSLRCLAITDNSAHRGPQERNHLFDAIAAALDGGATAVMLREKSLDTRALFDMAMELRRMTRSAGAYLIVNDRLDVALASQADGIHLGWRSLPIRAVQKAVPQEREPFYIGVSAHSPREALEAQVCGADYVTLSPIYPTPSKAGLIPVIGPQAIDQSRELGVSIPIIALGGIAPDNIAEVVKAGAAGVAMIRAILGADSPREVCQKAMRIYSRG